MNESLNILMLEDNADDAEIIQRILLKAGMPCVFHLAIDKDSFLKALSVFSPDVILSDNSLPQFNSEEALRISRQIYPDIPFILVTGTVSDAYAVSITKSGADDYILKDRLARLPAAIQISIHYRNAEKQKKAATQKLIESEEKYRAFVGRITEAFMALDKNGGCTYLNKQAAEMLQKGPEEVVGKNLWELFPDAVGSLTYRAFHRAMKEQHFVRTEDYYAPLDLWFESNIYPSAEGSSVFIRNISESKKAEAAVLKANEEKQALAERVSVIVNTLPANIALLDSNGFIIDVNASWRKFARENYYTGDDFGIGRNYIHISNNAYGAELEDGVKVASGIKAVLDCTLREFVFEYPCDSPTAKRWFRMVVTPLREKIYSGAVVMHIDISEIRKLEQERMKTNAEEQKKITRAILNAQEKERNLIGAELHDNVNQILAGTKLLLSIAQKNPEKSAEMIKGSIGNLQEAIEENRKIAHNLVVPNFKEILFTEQLRSLTEDMLKKAGIAVYMEIARFKEAVLEDELKLAIYRIAQEQCTNIIKYAGCRVVHIKLTTSKKSFRMTIADDGRGMDKATMVTGIGLANIKSRLSLFNGELSIATAPGKGFLLAIKIPLTQY